MGEKEGRGGGGLIIGKKLVLTQKHKFAFIYTYSWMSLNFLIPKKFFCFVTGNVHTHRTSQWQLSRTNSFRFQMRLHDVGHGLNFEITY